MIKIIKDKKHIVLWFFLACGIMDDSLRRWLCLSEEKEAKELDRGMVKV